MNFHYIIISWDSLKGKGNPNKLGLQTLDVQHLIKKYPDFQMQFFQNPKVSRETENRFYFVTLFIDDKRYLAINESNIKNLTITH